MASKNKAFQIKKDVESSYFPLATSSKSTLNLKINASPSKEDIVRLPKQGEQKMGAPNVNRHWDYIYRRG